jgi:hypothetical protein
MTEWRSVVGYEGRYAVSDAGEIMSMDYKGSGLPGLMRTSGGSRGYRQINLIVERGTVRRSLVHRLVARAFLGACPAGWQVNHKNGDKGDNRISNLEYCTPAQNKQHAVSTGLCSYRLGELHQNSKLKADQVAEIRKALSLGMTQAEIGGAYGVTGGTIGAIARGDTWSHLKDSITGVQECH